MLCHRLASNSTVSRCLPVRNARFRLDEVIVVAVMIVFARIIIGAIFLISGLAKISDPVRFILTLREFRLFPEEIVPLTAVWLPWLELLLGLCVLAGLLHRTAALLLACMNAGFLAAILSVIARGIVVDCGCFGMLADMLGLPDMADMKAVVRNVVFIGLCLLISFSRKEVLSLEGYILRVGK